MTEARALAGRLLAGAPLAQRAMKEVAMRTRTMANVEAIRFGETMRKVAATTEDALEGRDAGLSKGVLRSGKAVDRDLRRNVVGRMLRRPARLCRHDNAGLRLTFDVDVGEDPVEPAGHPPVAVAQQLHGRRHQHHADDGGVEQDGGRPGRGRSPS